MATISLWSGFGSVVGSTDLIWNANYSITDENGFALVLTPPEAFRTSLTSLMSDGVYQTVTVYQPSNGYVYALVSNISVTTSQFLGHPEMSLAGNDTVNGSADGEIIATYDGTDTVSAGGGNDTIRPGRGGGSVDGGSGSDTVEFTDFANPSLPSEGVTVDLVLGTAASASGDVSVTLASIENVIGSANADTLLGSGLGNTILGAGGNDRIAGRGGADNLAGGSGADTINGGAGADKITGGLGRDVLLGGTDGLEDTFEFTTLADSAATAAARDVIKDFQVGIDTIDLAAIDAIAGGSDDAFTFIGTHGFSHTAGELRVSATGGLLMADVDGNGIADLMIALVYSGANHTLTQDDFVL